MKKLNALFSIISLLLLLSISVNAQKPSALNGLEKAVEKYMEDWQVVGLSIAIVKDSQIVYAKGFGHRDLDKKLPADENTLFAIGSSSKAFTATGVAKLAEDGKIALDKPLAEYLPDFQLHDDYATKKMTARDLLCHRSGLPRHDFVWYGSDKSRKELFQALRHLEPNVSFRERWQYQNLMFMTAGYLIEEVSGQSWEDFTQAHLFDPLKMKTANFSVDEMQKTDNYSFPYNYDWEKDKVSKMDFRNIDAIGPAGSINASAKEMGNWVIMQLNEGRFEGKEVIGAAQLQETHRPQMIVPGAPNKEVFYRLYGLGWFITSYRGHTRIEHGGNIDGFSANVAFYPDDNLGIVVLTNQNGSAINGIIRNDIADKMLELETIDWNKRILEDVQKGREAASKAKEQEDLARKMDTSPSHKLEAYAGAYAHPGYGSMKVLFRKDSLFLETPLGELPLTHYHFDVFEMDVFGNKMKLRFDYDAQGEIVSLDMPIEPSLDHPIEFKRQEEEKELSEKELSFYAGEYEQSGVTVKIYMKAGKLKMFVPGQPEYNLVPTKEHHFSLENMEGFKVEFKLNGKEIKSLVSHQPNGSFEIPKK